MPTRQRNRFIIGHMAWTMGTILALSLLGALSLELFFVVSLIGFLVVVELTAPFNVTPQWRRRLLAIVVLGVVVFGGIVLRRIISILQDQGELPENLLHFGGL